MEFGVPSIERPSKTTSICCAKTWALLKIPANFDRNKKSTYFLCNVLIHMSTYLTEVYHLLRVT